MRVKIKCISTSINEHIILIKTFIHSDLCLFEINILKKLSFNDICAIFSARIILIIIIIWHINDLYYTAVYMNLKGICFCGIP